MVGVERHGDRITLCSAMNVLRYRDCAERHVLKRRARRNAPPPVEIWIIPSLLLSASPRSTAFAVVSEVTLMAGNAKRPARARSSILQ